MGTGGKNRLLAGLGLAAGLFFSAGDRINTSYNTAPAAAYAQNLESPEPAAAKPQAGVKGYMSPKNETGEQYNYPTKMPVTIHYKTLPPGVDRSKVRVFDPEDRYHLLGYDVRYLTDVGKEFKNVVPEEIKKYKLTENVWVQGDGTDILKKSYKDNNIEFLYADELDGKELDAGKNYIILIRSQFTDYRVITTYYKDGGVSHEYVAIGGEPFLKDRNLVRFIDPDTGRRMLNPEIKQLQLDYENSGASNSSSSNKSNMAYYTENDIYYWHFDPAGYPSGDYETEADTSEGTKRIKFTINNPNRPDPTTALRLGHEYTFKDEKMPWNAFWEAYSLETNDPMVVLSGTVDFEIPGLSNFSESHFPKGTKGGTVEVYLTKTTAKTRGHRVTDDNNKIREVKFGREPSICPIDTRRFPSGEYEMMITISTDTDSGTGADTRVLIQNNETVPTVTGLVSLGKPNRTNLPSFYKDIPPKITERSFFTLASTDNGGLVEYPQITQRMNVYLDGRHVYTDNDRSDLFPLTVTTDSARKGEANVFIPEGRHKLIAEAVYQSNILPWPFQLEKRFKVFDIEVVPSDATTMAQK